MSEKCSLGHGNEWSSITLSELVEYLPSISSTGFFGHFKVPLRCFTNIPRTHTKEGEVPRSRNPKQELMDSPSDVYLYIYNMPQENNKKKRNS